MSSSSSLLAPMQPAFVLESVPGPRALRNKKMLSLAPAATTSLPTDDASTSSAAVSPDGPPATPRHPRRLSTNSLPPVSAAPPSTTVAVLALRKNEDGGSPTAPYANGPVQIIPGVWLGSEDNARNTEDLESRGVRAILNVAREVSSPFAADSPALRPFVSTPDLSSPTFGKRPDGPVIRRPRAAQLMDYLKLDWSHGQADLVHSGFPAGMAFVDSALERGDGVLIHCQCGISRSATMVIALVMRAATTSSLAVPKEVWSLKGMQGAYDYVKEKSKCVGPNMSLIYQLMEYERSLKASNGCTSPSAQSSCADSDEEWIRQRQALDEQSGDEAEDTYADAVAREAAALDQAMIDRRIARKSSASSSVSSVGTQSLRETWKARRTARRMSSRASIASTATAGSVLSEQLIEEDEEDELLRLGIDHGYSPSADESQDEREPEAATPAAAPELSFSPCTPRPFRIAVPSLPPPSASAMKTSFGLPPPSASAMKTSFGLPPPSAPATRTSFGLPPPSASATKTSFGLPEPPQTAVRSSFHLPPVPTKAKRRPVPLSHLPPVPGSPTPPAIPAATPAPAPAPTLAPAPVPVLALAPPPKRTRTQSCRPTLPPLHLRAIPRAALPVNEVGTPLSAAPAQTLFVFPPSPTPNTRTPSTMTLFSNLAPVPFPASPAGASPPRLSLGKVIRHGRTRSFVPLSVPATPTTASSRVDARGFFGSQA